MKAFVVGFPKSGTVTLHRALSRSGMRSAHWKVPEGFCGELIYRADGAGRDPLIYLSAYDCVTQADVCLPGRRLNFWPNLDLSLITRIRRHHPGCVFILTSRDPVKVAASMRRWADMHRRLTKSDLPGLPPGRGGTQGELEEWIIKHYAACRSHFAGDSRFLDLDIEDAYASERLGDALGIRIKWWGVSNSGPRSFAPKAPQKLTDLSRAARKARYVARSLSRLAIAPWGALRKALSRSRPS